MIIQDLAKIQKKAFNESNSRINIWEGAVRSGKSFSSLIRFIQYIIDGPEGDLIVVGRTQDTIKRNVVAPLTEMLGIDVKYYSGKREMYLYDRRIHIIGASDERAEGKIRGATFAGAYVDEMTLIPESFFIMLLSRLSIDEAKLFATTNPDSPFHWVKTKFLDRKDELDLSSWHFKLEDNPSLSDQFKKDLSEEYQGLWYKRYIEGKWVLAEGSIYDFFIKRIHCMEIPPGLANYYIVGIDYGTSNPTAFVLIGYNPSLYPNIWLEKEYFYSSKKMERQKTDSEYADDFKKFIQGYNVQAIYLDPSAASFKNELRRESVSNIYDAKNDVLDGIRFQSKLMANGTYKICLSCKETIQEYWTYSWDEKAMKTGIDKPLKENDHLMDAQRYALYSHFYNREEGASLSIERLREMRMKASGSNPRTIEEFMKPCW